MFGNITDENYAKIGIGSQTEAQAARKKLLGLSEAFVVKIENRLKDGGCLYGIKVKKSDLKNTMIILHQNGITATVVQP